jgi:hypothetical protein
MVRQLIERTFDFPQNDNEREGPWAGITVLQNGKWEYYNDKSIAKNKFGNGNTSHAPGCVQFAYDSQYGQVPTSVT